MEENTDDDVQCITPGPAVTKKVNTNTPPPLIPRVQTILSEGSSDNIIQMTENDVTVNAATGGLKFRVDPQTLSSNKMYRLPDGRIFAINANPSMPGGYSATIVAVTENLSGKVASKGPTFAAKLSAIPAQTNTISVSKGNRSNVNTPSSRMRTPKSTKATKALDTTATASVTSRSVNSEIPVEWLRFSILDAVDSLEYSLSRLHKVKKEATSMNLRLCTVPEMKNIHKSLERLLHTSSTRFNEIRQNLNKDMKQYLARKKKANTNISEDDDDDDDVEILNDGDNDDPIFIDENSVDSNLNDTNCNESHDVDLTIVCSDHNDSGENIKEYSMSDQTNHKNNSNDDGYETSTKIFNENLHILKNRVEEKNTDCEENEDLVQTATCEKKENLKTSNITHAEDEIISLNEQRNINDKEISVNDDPSLNTNEDVEMENKSKNICNMEEKENTCDDVDKSRDPKSSDVLFEEGSKEENLKEEDEEKQLLNEDRSDIDKDSEKIPDTDMSDEMINNLLSDENPKQILGT